MRWKVIAFNNIFLAIRSLTNLRCKKGVILQKVTSVVT